MSSKLSGVSNDVAKILEAVKDLTKRTDYHAGTAIHRVSFLFGYSGTSLIKRHPSLGPYSRIMPRAVWWVKELAKRTNYHAGTPIHRPS